MFQLVYISNEVRRQDEESLNSVDLLLNLSMHFFACSKLNLDLVYTLYIRIRCMVQDTKDKCVGHRRQRAGAAAGKA